MYTSRMFDMWSNVTSKFEGHTALQTNVQANNGQSQSSGSIKGKQNNNKESNKLISFLEFEFVFFYTRF